DVLDYTDAVAKRLITFKIAEPTPEALELSRILVVSSEEVREGINQLQDLRHPDKLLKQCQKINQLENDADQVMRDALNHLFNGEKRDVLDIIKWKDIYEHLEIATDKCEDVANILETVLVKYT